MPVIGSIFLLILVWRTGKVDKNSGAAVICQSLTCSYEKRMYKSK